ncbi:NAD(P)-dependent oxidoreductase [Dyadobacter crusticola]|uniref:NAD(P)-dependent oxidoreductase n=1 Tax=Dyadobacter crusticola TaxID=292407 RepID=UPI0004E1A1BA|nr:NAD(P)H-binding protein [Dyadobacter crusticola]
MNIAVIGAAAGIGREAVYLGLERGHHMIAMSRDTSQMREHPMLTKVNASATSADELKKVMALADAVVITVGTKEKKGTTLFSGIARALVSASEDLDYQKPVIIVTGFGAGDSKPYLNIFMKAVIYLFLKDQYADKTLMEDMITKSTMNWEIVRPGILTNKSSAEPFRIMQTLEPDMKVGKVSRKNVASYLVTEAENPAHIGKKVTIT